jgi:quercetin dioxygenase-like cupin family protein
LRGLWRGEIDVDYEDGTQQRYKAGDVIAEVVELSHCGLNAGKVPVKILLFEAGEQGVPLSNKMARPQ